MMLYLIEVTHYPYTMVNDLTNESFWDRCRRTACTKETLLKKRLSTPHPDNTLYTVKCDGLASHSAAHTVFLG